MWNYAPAVTALLAQSNEPTGVLDWIQYGVLGLIIVAAMAGWIEFKPGIKRLEDDKNQLRTALLDLVKTYEERAIPLLAEANRVLTRLAEYERRDHPRPPWDEGGRPWRGDS